MTALTLPQLERLSVLWIDSGSGVEDAWRPGLSEAEAQELARAHPALALPQELLMWWGWHNGAEPPWSLSQKRFHYSLQNALNHYGILREAGATESYLLPIVDGLPEILVECHPDRPEVGRVFLQHHSEWPELRLGSVGELVDIWIGFLETGAWYYDTDGQAQIAEELAPPDLVEFL